MKKILLSGFLLGLKVHAYYPYLGAPLGQYNYEDDQSGQEISQVPPPPMQSRPYTENRRGQLQPLPPMITEGEVVEDEEMTPDGPTRQQALLLRRHRPSNYRPLVPPSRRQPSPSHRDLFPPPSRQLLGCRFDPLYKQMLAMLNGYRRKACRSSGPVDLCMNAKLMRAAKLQSDFQALARVPTHGGPRESNLGSLEDRLAWAKYKSYRDSAEELIFYWPYGPREQGVMIKKLQKALRAWTGDPDSQRILRDQRYRFFGFGLTRARGGTFLTVILADSPSESCHVCPEDMSLNPPSNTQDRNDRSNIPRPIDEDDYRYWR